MSRPNWRTGTGHVLRWALVAETVVALHLATVRIDDRATTYPAPSTTSVAVTHVCGDGPCAVEGRRP